MPTSTPTPNIKPNPTSTPKPKTKEKSLWEKIKEVIKKFPFPGSPGTPSSPG